MNQADRRPLLVVVPAYNEAETIEEVITRSLPHADVCIVDDCSSDDTAVLAEAIPGTHVLRHEQNTHIAGALLDGFRPAHVLPDKAYDSNALRTLIADIGATAVIPCNPTRKRLIAYSFEVYKARNRIERCFNKLKHFRRIATRYDRCPKVFLSACALAEVVMF